ncbi:MAG: hypothetical protein WA118_08275 [Carboxydocellales bacterium]
MKFKKTSFTGTKEILKYADHDSIPVMVDDTDIAANADGKKIVAAGTIVGGATKAVLTNRQEPVQKKNAQSTFDTLTVGANNSMVKVTAKAAGDSGLSFEMLDPAGNDKALAVSVVGKKVSVSLATGPAGAITSTAAEVIASINNQPDANELVTAANGTGSDGTGVVVAAVAADLTSGAAGVGLDAEGVLLYDVDVTDGNHPGAMVIRGAINQNQIPEVPCADALAALKGRIVFMK